MPDKKKDKPPSVNVRKFIDEPIHIGLPGEPSAVDAQTAELIREIEEDESLTAEEKVELKRKLGTV